MTEHSPTNITPYWNDELVGELLRFLTGRLKCPETAADLTQETYLRFHQFIQESPPDNARALAYRIAINLANDYQRKIKVRNRFSGELDPDLDEDDYASETPGPEQRVMAQQRFAALQTALDELDNETRTVFLLHSVDGLTHQEIADRLHISRIKVYRLLVKALAHLSMRVESG